MAKSLKRSLSALFSHPEDQIFSNETGLDFLYVLLFFHEKIASTLRAARCHILGLLHLMTPHSVTPVYSPACFSVSCHFPNRRIFMFAKQGSLVKYFQRCCSSTQSELLHMTIPKDFSSEFHSSLFHENFQKIFVNFFILLEMSSLLLFIL